MCVAVYKPAATTLTKADIIDMYCQNPDGLGVMWCDNDGLQVYRALPRSEEEAWQMYHALPLNERDAVLHFRWATHGSVRVENTHPFQVIDGLYMVHNGVLSVASLHLDCGGDRTDSEAYIDAYLRPLLRRAADPLSMVTDTPFRSLIGSHIGTNKFVFMDSKGRVSIVNKHLGATIRRGKTGDFWASNTNWEAVIPKSYAADSPQVRKLKWEDDPAALYTPTSWDEFTPTDEEVREYLSLFTDIAGTHQILTDGVNFRRVDEYIREVGLYTAWEMLEQAADDKSQDAIIALRDDILLWAWPMTS